ncbi:hypothetical protein CR513_43818, partial [Mucuna pruriens]
MASSNIPLVLGLCLAINMAVPTLAATHTVGDTSGWAIGADYTTWASGLKFKVGDTLVFNYESGHTVDEVTESDYKSCSAGNSLSTDSSGATTIALKTAGTHYFICSVPGHCKGGMKLAVKVKAKKVIAPSAAPSPSDNTKDTPPSSTLTTTTTTPSTPSTPTSTASTFHTTSSATSSSPILAVFILSCISYFL